MLGMMPHLFLPLAQKGKSEESRSRSIISDQEIVHPLDGPRLLGVFLRQNKQGARDKCCDCHIGPVLTGCSVG